MDFAPIARILLRYVGGALVAKGVFHDASSFLDPDVVQVACILIGAGCSLLSEGWYLIAKKRKWSI